MADPADFFGALGSSPNQTAFDQADNGVVHTDTSGTTYTPPDWLSSLQRVASTGASIYGAVTGTGSSPARAATAAAAPPPAAPPAPAASSGKGWMRYAGIAGAAFLVFLLLIKRK